jgi:diguanylate cyclase
VTRYKCSLLIVDDEPAILTTLSRLLASEFEVLTAESAEEAMAVLRLRPIDIVLSDQRMPRLTGVQLLEWVRQHTPRTIRLLMTGFAELENAVEAINRSQVFRYIFKPCPSEEMLATLRDAAWTFELERSNAHLLEELRRLNVELERRVQQRTAELEEANQELEQKNQMLEKLALTDPLTGLPNRRAMDRLAKNALQRRMRYASPLALALIDADHFKDVNSKFLLSGGDHALIWLGRAMASTLRTVDTIGRIGGEEFMVIAPETTLEGAAVLAERIRATVAGTAIYYNDEPIRITASLGFAVVEVGVNTDYEQMKHVAASALNEAKSTGRNRCIVRTIPPALDQAG